MTTIEQKAREAAALAYPPGTGRLGHGTFDGEPATGGFRERWWFKKGYTAAAKEAEQPRPKLEKVREFLERQGWSCAQAQARIEALAELDAAEGKGEGRG